MSKNHLSLLVSSFRFRQSELRYNGTRCRHVMPEPELRVQHGVPIMTVTLNITSQTEQQLQRQAAIIGMPIQEYIMTIVENAASSDTSADNMADYLRSIGVLGAIDGTKGPGDGRSWSEIEAACDPL